LIAGVIDEFTLDIASVPLGSGKRIFDGIESFGFEPPSLHSPLTTHIRYGRVSRLCGRHPLRHSKDPVVSFRLARRHLP
jgi:hypothetical protein